MKKTASHTARARRLLGVGLLATGLVVQRAAVAAERYPERAWPDSLDIGNGGENSPPPLASERTSTAHGATPDTVQTETASSASEAPVNPYAKYAKYITKGFILPIPDPSNYVDPDAGGLRAALSDKGFGYWGYSLDMYTYDLHNRGHTDGPQAYSGEKPTFASYNYLYLSDDLSRYGIENGQLSASVALVYASWTPAGPSRASISTLQYYQTLFHGKVEITLGNLDNDFIYNNIYVGGNLASGTFGLGSNIPAETGQSDSNEARPGVNVKFNIGHGFYYRVGVQRSINPAGQIEERKANPSGLTLGGKGIGALYLGELGYRQAATPDAMDTWIRAGYRKNNSDYADMKRPGTTDHNYSAMVLADRQLYRMGGSAWDAYRGIYAGMSVMYAPPDVNTFSRYYELRLYSKGLFASRPGDMISLVWSKNIFSRYAVLNARRAGSPTDSDSASVSLSYSANVARGVFLTSGFSYISHPMPVVTAAGQGTGLNFTLAAQIFY